MRISRVQGYTTAQMDSLFSYGDLQHLFSESLCEFPGADRHAPRKRLCYEPCNELLDDTSALHEWPVPAKRARREHDGAYDGAWEHGDSLDSRAFPQKNATPSLSESSPLRPARPRANAMHILDEGGVRENDVMRPTRGSSSHHESTSLFVRFAQLAACRGITPLHLPPPDEFPTALQMETLVRAIVAT